MAEKNGFILECAERQRRASAADGTLSAVIGTAFGCLFVTVCFFCPDPAVIAVTAAYVILMIPLLRQAFMRIKDARRVYDFLENTVRDMDGEEYGAACAEITETRKSFGGFYLGENYLYSPFGLLVKWQDIKGVTAEFVYGRYFAGERSYRMVIVTFTLSGGVSGTAEISGSRAAADLSLGIDGFFNIITSICGGIPTDKLYR
ncbi:MAG: hypothetical protein NC120_00625 [Ruminococcus sp.]|nr:hypothetical protein [Ruminococcus sp.]